MEQNTDYTQTAAYVMPTVSESAKENFSEFKNAVGNNFDDIFRFDEVQLIPREKCAEAHIPLSMQVMIEDLVDDLAKRLKMNILFAVSMENGKTIKVIAYSMPYKDELYVVAIETMQYGIVEGITVAFYDSMDDMFSEVRHHYLAGRYLLEEPGAEQLEAEDYQTFFSHFV